MDKPSLNVHCRNFTMNVIKILKKFSNYSLEHFSNVWHGIYFCPNFSNVYKFNVLDIFLWSETANNRLFGFTEASFLELRPYGNPSLFCNDDKI